MKIHSFVTEILFFSIISLFFVIPPLFVNAPSVQHIDFTLFSVQNFSHFVIAVFIFVFYKKLVENDEQISTKILKYLIYFVVIFILLFGISFICNFSAQKFLNSENSFVNSQVFVENPQGFFDFLICIFNLLFAAFFEEVIYRFYIPFGIKNFLFRKVFDENQSKSYTIFEKSILLFIEIVTMLIFSFSHKYLGIFSVVNAAVAHLVLRFSFIPSKSLIPSTLAHFFYNFVSLMFGLA